MTGFQLKLAGVGKEKTAHVTSLDCSVSDLRRTIAQSIGDSCRLYSTSAMVFAVCSNPKGQMTDLHHCCM